ncbi:MAG: oligosaccharide flippase family protein [Chloroflexota bacterium]|nr:oligosaccharide flippase family protein [Chloroflexota bacterium]
MRRRLPDLLVIALLFLLPMILFWQQTVGGRTLLPTENIYQYEPFATYRDAAGAPPIPHNHLLSDLVLQNVQFKDFIRDQFAIGEFPLWNPHQFAGIPFFAAGQQSTLYPFSILFYIMDLPAAYGWFTIVQLWLAGVFMFIFARGLGTGRFGATVAGVTYQLSAFFVISAVFPMIIAGATWLPLILLMIEYITRRQPALRGQDGTPLWAALGALALGCNVLAGHVEITLYTLLIAGFYAAWRLVGEWLPERKMRTRYASSIASGLTRAGWLLAMVVLGMALGAVQFIPTFEAANSSFRAGRATFEQILDYAHPPRDVLQFIMPNFYGNPAHHTIYDWFSGQTIQVTINALRETITHTEWGIKNYVEGALYVGILPLALAVYAGVLGIGTRSLLFTILALISLTFMFGLPTYALLYYLFPGVNQLHSPFRWVFALTLCVSVLAGFGADRLMIALTPNPSPSGRGAKMARVFGYGLLAIGTLTLGGLLASRLLYTQVAPVIETIFGALAGANRAYADATQFYTYQFTNVLVFGVMAVCSGALFWWVARVGAFERTRHAASLQIGVVVLIAVDLMIASWAFNPASDAVWLDYTPPAIEWLQTQDDDWRYTTLETPGRPAIMNANLGMRYGLDDVRGYESIISRQYAEYMGQLAPQYQLAFNRVAPLFTTDDGWETRIESPLLDALNVRFLLTYSDQDVSVPGWTLAYSDDALRIYENTNVFPRAYLLPADANLAALADSINPAALVLSQPNARERLIEVVADAGSIVVLSETYASGWRAFVRPQGGTDAEEVQVETELAFANFIAVRLPESGEWTLRLIYSPTSFQVGAFASFIGGALMLLIVGAWLWRLFVNRTQSETTDSTAQRVARNSLAPIILNLFNRGIDFAFAAVMLRLLGPELNGLYYYAIVLFGWFDIFTNFGLNLYVMREVARERAAALRLFVNTSALRLLLSLLGIPLLLLFLAVRQTDTANPLPDIATLAITLLYIGLIPSSLSTGLTALYYAFERAEIPAAVTTVATICKTIFGLAVLLAGWGIVGLAAASIITNVITLAILAWNARGMLSIKRQDAKDIRTVDPPGRPLVASSASERFTIPSLDFSLMRNMIGQSYPLMLNHFLATIFFKIDIILIEAIHTATMVGQYSVAYKWLEALNIIPSFFTQALLPAMSRQAHDDRAAFRRTYQLALKLLFSVALPVAIAFTFMAFFLVNLLGGAEYLPDGAIALQLMIWSIPIGWMNSLTQYALIALDLQRRVTWAFAAGVSFNIITNLLFIPTYGYRAAALTTIASELVLLIGFWWLLRTATGQINPLAIIGRPLLAGVAMFAVLLVGWQAAPLVALVISGLVYGGVLLALRPLTEDEWARLAPLLPSRLRRLVVAT